MTTGFRTQLTRAWTVVRPGGLYGTAAVIAVLAVVAFRATEAAWGSALAPVFAGAGSALLIAGLLMLIGRRSDLVTAILGALSAASFGIALAELSSKPGDPGRYDALLPSVWIAGCLLAFEIFRDSSDRDGEERTR